MFEGLLAVLLMVLLLSFVGIAMRKFSRNRRASMRGLGPSGPGSGGDYAGDREPRRPKPFAGAGAVSLPLPNDSDDG